MHDGYHYGNVYEETRDNLSEAYGIASRGLKDYMGSTRDGQRGKKDEDDDSGLAY